MRVPPIDIKIRKRLAAAIVLTGVVFIAELVGGYVTNSLALMSDALHVFMDLLALSLSLFALYIAKLPPTEKRTYGLHRVEVLAAFMNGVTLFLMTLFIFYKAYLRLLAPPQLKPFGMVLIALAGLVVNIIVAVRLRDYAGKDLNVRSAFVHVVGDAVASVGVIVAALIIYLTGFNAIDALISGVIGVIILYGSSRIILDASHILLEGAPRDVDFSHVLEEMSGIEGVEGVHSLHIWSICHNVHALSAHVDIGRAYMERQSEILININKKLAGNYRIYYTTLQVECPGCVDNGVLRAIEHRER